MRPQTGLEYPGGGAANLIQTQICEVQRAYDYFCGQLEEALKQTVQGKLENSGASEEQLLVIHTTRAYASKAYLQKLLEFENTKAL